MATLAAIHFFVGSFCSFIKGSVARRFQLWFVCIGLIYMAASLADYQIKQSEILNELRQRLPVQTSTIETDTSDE